MAALEPERKSSAGSAGSDLLVVPSRVALSFCRNAAGSRRSARGPGHPVIPKENSPIPNSGTSFTPSSQHGEEIYSFRSNSSESSGDYRNDTERIPC